MTRPFSRPRAWTRLVRSLRPSHGARRNAEEGVADVRLSRAQRAQAAAAFRTSSSEVPTQRSWSEPAR